MSCCSSMAPEMRRGFVVGVVLPVTLLFGALAGCKPAPAVLLGTLEWDRVAVLVEAAEPIVSLDVAEGDVVSEGQVLMQLDARRGAAQLAQARAEEQRLQANLLGLQHGTRIETVDAARAALNRATTQEHNAELDYQRLAELQKTNDVSKQALDTADASRRAARADSDSQRAQLAQLLHGTRVEDLNQAEAALASAQANSEHAQLTLARLTVRAPRAGRIDALPFKLGDQPPQGAALVSLLVGDQPYARVFVPASKRAAFPLGAHFRVFVEGVPAPFDAQLRSLRARPDFTPYYALTGDDASQLTYRAELVLPGDTARQLPAGLPLHVETDPPSGAAHAQP